MAMALKEILQLMILKCLTKTVLRFTGVRHVLELKLEYQV